jgi:hypothetical protein
VQALAVIGASPRRVRKLEGANPLTDAPARHTECRVLTNDRRQSVWAPLAKSCEEIMKADFVELKS